MEMLKARWEQGKSVCVGLDSELGKIPAEVKYPSKLDRIRAFNRAIIEHTSDLVCAYKVNLAFYVAQGIEGILALYHTVSEANAIAPEVPIILDAKYADIGNTNVGYVEQAFGYLHADAVTLNPYFGKEALEPFLAQKDKGCIIVCRSSNVGAGEFQNLLVGGVPLYRVVALNVACAWNENGNCAVVVGATYPDELRAVRKIVGDMPILVPGIGAQGGDLEATVAAGKDSRGQGMIIAASRSIIFAGGGQNFAEAARRETQRLHDAINRYRS
jgi:orotidine-5'-phosphate decarboxylase